MGRPEYYLPLPSMVSRDVCVVFAWSRQRMAAMLPVNTHLYHGSLRRLILLTRNTTACSTLQQMPGPLSLHCSVFTTSVCSFALVPSQLWQSFHQHTNSSRLDYNHQGNITSFQLFWQFVLLLAFYFTILNIEPSSLIQEQYLSCHLWSGGTIFTRDRNFYVLHPHCAGEWAKPQGLNAH